jgi:hypothetical protein
MALAGAVISSPSADGRAVAEPIDFAALHQQATAAMQRLQGAHNRQMAFQLGDEAAF